MTGLALYPNAAMMTLDERLAEIETESQAEIQFVLDRAPFPTVEAIPKAPLLFQGDAGSFVVHRDTYEVVRASHLDSHGPLGGGIVEGIRQVESEHLGDAPSIGENRHRMFGCQVFQFNCAFGHRRSLLHHCYVDQGEQVAGLERQTELIGLDARIIDQILHHALLQPGALRCLRQGLLGVFKMRTCTLGLLGKVAFQGLQAALRQLQIAFDPRQLCETDRWFLSISFILQEALKHSLHEDTGNVPLHRENDSLPLSMGSPGHIHYSIRIKDAFALPAVVREKSKPMVMSSRAI